MMTGQPGTFSFVQCTRCGLVRLHPRPADMAPFYPDDYESYASHEGRAHSPLSAVARSYGSYKRARIVERASGLRGGAVLDVGCAGGAFLEVMRGRGWQVCGVEPNASAVSHAHRRGLDVLQGELEAVSLPPEHFDVVTLWDVLEHVPDPLSTLRAAHRALKPGGALVLRVPSPLSLDVRLFGRYWAGLDAPRHLWLFSRTTLDKLLLLAGFRTASRRWEYGPYQLWRISAEFWLGAHAPPALRRPMQTILRSPLTQAAMWPLACVITHSELNSVLLVAAYR